MAHKRPEVTRQTKINLRQAFWRLYEKRPLEKITVRQITDLAGYNRGTFYLYFRDIYDMLEKIEQEVLEVISGMINDLRPSTLVQVAQTYGCYARVLLSDRGDPAFKARFKEMVWPRLKQAVIGKQVFSASEETIIKEFYLAGLIAAITAWLDEENPLPIKDFISLLGKQLLAPPMPLERV